MMAEREQPHAVQTSAARQAVAPQELEDLLFTLRICRQVLPWDAHPVHGDRLQRIEALVRERLQYE